MRKNIDDELEKRRLDLRLDTELQDTFPASDALKITRPQTDVPKTLKRSGANGLRRRHRLGHG